MRNDNTNRQTIRGYNVDVDLVSTRKRHILKNGDYKKRRTRTIHKDRTQIPYTKTVHKDEQKTIRKDEQIRKPKQQERQIHIKTITRSTNNSTRGRKYTNRVKTHRYQPDSESTQHDDKKPRRRQQRRQRDVDKTVYVTSLRDYQTVSQVPRNDNSIKTTYNRPSTRIDTTAQTKQSITLTKID